MKEYIETISKIKHICSEQVNCQECIFSFIVYNDLFKCDVLCCPFCVISDYDPIKPRDWAIEEMIESKGVIK